jgi:hypothetical protein
VSDKSLTLPQRQVIVKRHLAGETCGDIEGYAGLSALEIRNLLQTQGMKDIICEEKGYYDQVNARARLKWSFDLEDAVDRNIARGKDNSNPQIAFQADKLTIESFLPKVVKQVTENDTHVTFDANIVAQISTSLDKVTEILSTNSNREPLSTYTLTGSEGVASLAPEADKPNGSGKSSEPTAPAKLSVVPQEPDDPADPPDAA